MNDNLYHTQIDEIDGEIASLKVALKRTSDEERRKEIEEDIKHLEEQRDSLIKGWNKNGGKGFKDKYRVDSVQQLYCVTDEYHGPSGREMYEDD